MLSLLTKKYTDYWLDFVLLIRGQWMTKKINMIKLFFFCIYLFILYLGENSKKFENKLYAAASELFKNTCHGG